MAWTQADLDSLDKAIKSGAEEIRFKENSVKLRGLAEMMATRRLILKELGRTKKKNRFYPRFSKGL
jgi:hypothetical protein